MYKLDWTTVKRYGGGNTTPANPELAARKVTIQI